MQPGALIASVYPLLPAEITVATPALLRRSIDAFSGFVSQALKFWPMPRPHIHRRKFHPGGRVERVLIDPVQRGSQIAVLSCQTGRGIVAAQVIIEAREHLHRDNMGVLGHAVARSTASEFGVLASCDPSHVRAVKAEIGCVVEALQSGSILRFVVRALAVWIEFGP